MPQRKYYGNARNMAKRLYYYRQVQKYHRDKWLELDIKINAAEHKLKEHNDIQAASVILDKIDKMKALDTKNDHGTKV